MLPGRIQMAETSNRADNLPGFTYFVSDNQLRSYVALPIRARLQWLEETLAFLYKTAPPEAQRNWHRLRQGR